MPKDVTIVIAEDDAGHCVLIQKNLRRAGLKNPIQIFESGQDLLDCFFDERGVGRELDHPVLVLLDIRMPKVDGIEVLRRLKADPRLRRIPVIMLTTTDDPREVERCHGIGCNSYIVKPVDYEKFAQAIEKLGLFLSLVEVPEPSQGTPA